jgi:hypothetical protein
MNLKTITGAVLGAAVLAAIGAGVRAQTPGARMDLGPVNPAPGWGTTSTYNIYVRVNGKPVRKGTSVQFYFSGQHGLQTPKARRYTDANGRVTFSEAIPRYWSAKTGWVNANAICPDLGLQAYWQVKK